MKTSTTIARTKRPVEYSKVSIAELMVPTYTNFGGKVHGGVILSLMDKVAYACASKHAGTYCVTVAVDAVDFHQPAEVGNLVSFHASVNYVKKTSLVVGIKVLAENLKTGEVKHTNSSFFSLVAKGEDGEPMIVPELILESVDDVRRFVNVVKKRKLKADYLESVRVSRENFTFNDDLDLLRDESCHVVFDY